MDGRLVGEGDIPRTVPFAWGFCGGLRCGHDDHNISDDYVSAFPFTGEIENIVVELAEDLMPVDVREQLRIEMANQ